MGGGGWRGGGGWGQEWKVRGWAVVKGDFQEEELDEDHYYAWKLFILVVSVPLFLKGERLCIKRLVSKSAPSQ